MDKDQCEKNIKKSSVGETDTINGPNETERSEREWTRQPHELPSAGLLITASQNSSNDFKAKTEEVLKVFPGAESSLSLDLTTEDMDTLALVSYLMSPLNTPGEDTEVEAETFNFETILNDKIYENGDIEFINILDENFSKVFDDDESFDEG